MSSLSLDASLWLLRSIRDVLPQKVSLISSCEHERERQRLKEPSLAKKTEEKPDIAWEDQLSGFIVRKVFFSIILRWVISFTAHHSHRYVWPLETMNFFSQHLSRLDISHQASDQTQDRMPVDHARCLGFLWLWKKKKKKSSGTEKKRSTKLLNANKPNKNYISCKRIPELQFFQRPEWSRRSANTEFSYWLQKQTSALAIKCTERFTVLA